MGVWMDEQELRELIATVKARRVSRRTFIRKMLDLSLTAPLANQLLTSAGLAQAPAPVDYKPAHAGGGGALRTLLPGERARSVCDRTYAIQTRIGTFCNRQSSCSSGSGRLLRRQRGSNQGVFVY